MVEVDVAPTTVVATAAEAVVVGVSVTATTIVTLATATTAAIALTVDTTPTLHAGAADLDLDRDPAADAAHAQRHPRLHPLYLRNFSNLNFYTNSRNSPNPTHHATLEVIPDRPTLVGGAHAPTRVPATQPPTTVV